MSVSGRFSPYSRYVMQRELSAPALNRIESFDSDDGEFYCFVDENGNPEESGRQTSIGFAHQKQMSVSMSNLSKARPQSELRKQDARYMSTPNFIKINKKAVIQSTPMEKINPRLVMHRSLKGVLKVYNNTNIRTNRTFSVDNMEIFLPNGKIDPNLLAPMPINVDGKRSVFLTRHQIKAEKKRKLALKRRKLSPIAGTPNKDSKEKEDSNKTPKRKLNTPATRLEERLKKDKFGRLLTPKKASLPDFRNIGKKPKKKKNADDKEDDPDEILGMNGRFEPGRFDKPPEEENKEAAAFLKQLQAKNVLGRTLKARLAAKNPPPLTRQPSKQSIDSLFQDPPTVKKRSSFSSLKSLSASIRTVTSFTRSNKSYSHEDEEAEKGDEITKLQNVKDAKNKAKTSILAKSKMLGLTGRLTSASSTRSKKDVTVPPPSRSASKTSIMSRGSAKNVVEPDAKAAAETPSKKSEVLRAPSSSSIMSMTTAAITSNPLNTTLAITNQLATQGSEINEKKRAMGILVDKPTPPVAAETVVASHPDADKMSLASQKTVSSQKTNTSVKGGSRKASAKNSRINSAASTKEPMRSRKGSLMGVIAATSAIRYLRRKKSSDSINSAKDDGTHVTSGLGHGADNNDYSNPIAGKILEKSQQSLERVQKTVDKATSEIHQTINANLTDLRTLEKNMSKSNLLDHDANNNDVEKGSAKGLSRHSTKLDMGSTSRAGGMSASKMKPGVMGGDAMSVNAISVEPEGKSGLQQQASEDSNQMSSTR